MTSPGATEEANTLETLLDDYYKEAAFCSMCGPKFCSMNYSSKVDEYNKQVHGIEKKDYSELVEKLATLKSRRITKRAG